MAAMDYSRSRTGAGKLLVTREYKMVFRDRKNTFAFEP
jgi:hypothetical protein